MDLKKTLREHLREEYGNKDFKSGSYDDVMNDLIDDADETMETLEEWDKGGVFLNSDDYAHWTDEIREILDEQIKV